MENTFRETGGIETVLFDFGGVLSEEGFRNGLQAIARLNGLDEKTFVRTANDVIHACGYVIGKVSESAYWEMLRGTTGIRGDDQHLRNEILSRFIMREWMIDTVKKLKTIKLRVGILSDQTNWLDELDDRYDFFRLFDYVFNSYRMGKSKKDPTHFEDVVRMLGTEAHKVLFVDDDAGNCERAKQAGLKVIHYMDREQFLEEISRYFPAITS
ncbi:MAG: HAD family phosphatase [Syntrophales bacterium]|jgi:putative hydrolase of the HAD superfamily